MVWGSSHAARMLNLFCVCTSWKPLAKKNSRNREVTEENENGEIRGANEGGRAIDTDI
jgi:hypothetical protein